MVRQNVPQPLEPGDLLLHLGQPFRVVARLCGVLQTIVLRASFDHVRRRGPEVLAWLAVHALAGEAAVVHAFIATERLELLVDAARKGLACLLDPLSAVEGAALQRTSPLGMLAVRASEPVVRGPLDPVVLALRHQDVDVRVVLVAVSIAAGVNRKRVRQALLVRLRLDELSRHLDLIFNAEIARQREVAADVQPAVRALIEVCRVPVRPRIVFRPILA